MVDRGPLLTSAIIFYLAIGAAIFEVLEEPHWKEAKKNYYTQKLHLLKEFPCLGQEGLDKILQVVSDAAGQGVAITGNQTFNNWNWPNAMIFAATVITTIGYGNVAPKTPAGRLFCVFYGLFGVPLCLTWISALGKFFGGRAKRLGQFLTRRGVSLRKAQITCTAIFIVWGVLVHLVIPPFVFMVTEEWDYIEGLYYSFITISTIGFGDFVAGVNPSANYHALYRYFVELWIYLGLAWLSLFVNWKVSMFVEVHKAIKKRRRRRKESFESSPHSKKALQIAGSTASKDINIFSFLSKKEETYNDLIKQIGKKGMKTNGTGERVPAVGLGPQGGGLPALPTSLAPLVVYSKNRVPSLEEVSQTLRNKGHVSRPLSEEVGAGPPKDGSLTPEVFINQLDRISEEGEPWDAQDYHPLIFQNVNITFTNEEAGLSDEETSKSSIEDNLAGEERPQEGAEAEVPLNLGEFPSSDESTFTSTESELSVPYEQLVNEYNKSDCPRGT
ncbi:potassium channel subfamily k [Lynx pardinus]|uniref:Potassium channel domain-containing protein n=5 Tax=Felidae TaxID=9681 RepID=A0ABI7ZNA1_FELCA|nr:potassium channel subfamily K member 5 isoform X1 [Felis catus]XP_030171285.1 potassium channel subfamily K member 5 [Lynx canadensis]XP_043447243.1 potassium channel subfamily K member 5 [Prionailurus bengalensis]XP_045354031.1 potassium channel subfamily K member 5 [Leopardus geoffroyi]XP_046958610.1 potassium channel subfamily K member 5 [Lynx rufus]XP_047715974.1 potassium channel subfamily K member 5 [Prionailurus viverrinus]XP_058589791.1 potassium channel subfamily K member 5 [Neofe